MPAFKRNHNDTMGFGKSPWGERESLRAARNRGEAVDFKEMDEHQHRSFRPQHDIDFSPYKRQPDELDQMKDHANRGTQQAFSDIRKVHHALKGSPQPNQDHLGECAMGDAITWMNHPSRTDTEKAYGLAYVSTLRSNIAMTRASVEAERATRGAHTDANHHNEVTNSAAQATKARQSLVSHVDRNGHD